MVTEISLKLLLNGHGITLTHKEKCQNIASGIFLKTLAI
jgi:hypothetical protein